MEDADEPQHLTKRGGRHKPIPPRKELEHWISYYWHLGFPDPKIADHVLDHFDRNIYGLSQKSVQRVRKQLGLKGAIQEAATFETIAEIYKVLRARFPAMGARRMVTVIRQDYSIRVSEKLINDYLRNVEPEAVAKRKRGLSLFTSGFASQPGKYYKYRHRDLKLCSPSFTSFFSCATSGPLH